MSKSPEMVLEGTKLDRWAVLFPNVGLYWIFVLEHMKNGSFCKKLFYESLYNCDTLF